MKLSPRTITFALGLLALGLLAGCANTPTSTPSPTVTVDRQAAGVEGCATTRAACKVGDISIGGGTVFYVEGEGDSKVVLEYAPASAEGYRLVGTLQWHLPMGSELKKLYANWAATKAREFVVAKESATDPTNYYWMFDCCTLWFMAGAIDFNTGRGDSDLASSLSGVRPIRGY